MENAILNDLAQLGDAELLKTLGTQKDNDLKYKTYWVLYQRHEKFVWLQCRKVCKKAQYFDPELPNLLFEKTMEQLLRKGHMIFKNKIIPPEEEEHYVRGFLGLTARSLFYRVLNTYGQVLKYDLPIDFNLEWVPAYEPPPDDEPTVSDAIFRDALNSLKPMEKDILITYAQHAGKDNRIPEEFRQSLKHEHKLTDANLRKIHQRARIKLKNFVNKKIEQDEIEPRNRVAKNGKSPEGTPAVSRLSVLRNSPTSEKAKGVKPRRKPAILPGKSTSHIQQSHGH